MNEKILQKNRIRLKTKVTNEITEVLINNGFEIEDFNLIIKRNVIKKKSNKDIKTTIRSTNFSGRLIISFTEGEDFETDLINNLGKRIEIGIDDDEEEDEFLLDEDYATDENNNNIIEN